MWNGLDWVLCVIVVLSILSAAFKGFVQEVVALGTVFAGIAVAALGYRRLTPWFEDLTKSSAIAEGLAFLLLFLAVMALGALVSSIARRLIAEVHLTGVDRFLGAVFGLVRGVIVATVLLLALVAFSIKTNAVEQSDLAPYVLTGARLMALAMPQGLRNRFESGFQGFKSAMMKDEKKAKVPQAR